MIGQSNLPKRIGIVSVPTLLVALTAADFFEISGVFNPTFLIAFLNLSFVTLVSLLVAYRSARSYLESGLSTVALLGTGVLTYGLGLFLTGLAFTNSLVVGASIATVSFLIAGTLQVVSAYMTWKGVERYRDKRRVRLAVSYGGSILILCLISFLFETGIVSAPFPIGGVLYQTLSGISVVFFAISALMIAAAYLRTKSPVLYWYSLALALIAIGIGGFALVDIVGDLDSWIAAISNYVGCLLFLQATRTSRSPSLT